MVVTTNDWTNIPYYPTSKEKKEEYAQQLVSMGKQVPQELLRQIELDKAKEVKVQQAQQQTGTNTPAQPGQQTTQQVPGQTK